MKRKRSSETDFAVSSSAAAVPARRSAAPRARKNVPVTSVEIESETVSALTPVENAYEAMTVSEPTYAEVAALAYSFWESRGCQGGSPEEDWLMAERQLRARTA